MSKPILDEKKRIIVPYVGIERIIELATVMYKNSVKEKTLTELGLLWGEGKSNLKNITPAFSNLGLGIVTKGIFKLTSDGLIFADACYSKDTEKAKQVIRKNIPKSEALQFTKSLLETRSTISADEIGRDLSDRFRKKWKDIRTTKHAGNACASILSFAGIGYHYNGLLTVNPPTISHSISIPPPDATNNEIIDVLNALHNFERAKVSDIAIKLKQKEQYVYQKLIVCTTLKFVDRYASNIYRLTENGEKFIEPIIDKKTKQNLFCKSILQSPYKELISKISKIEEEITNDNIGNVIVFYLKRNWSDTTKKLYAKKFLTWLLNSNILIKIKPSTYKINLEQIQTYSEKNEETETSPKENLKLDFFYELGRGIGNLEVLSKNDRNETFKDRIAFLKSMLNEHEDLKFALDMLATNFEISQKTDNVEIYKASLDFIRNKIKEKFHISEEIF